jgi:hypothetical protein
VRAWIEISVHQTYFAAGCEMMASPVVAEDGTGVVTVRAYVAAGRGYSYSEMENLLVAKAYILAAAAAGSEDEDPAIKGNNYDQPKATTSIICDQVFAHYVALCVEQTKLNYLNVDKMVRNAYRGSKLVAKSLFPDTTTSERPTNAYKTRTATAVWGQFKGKIAKECMAYGNIVATHPALSGEETESDNRARWMYLYKTSRRDDGADFKYENCWEFLKDQPQWKVYMEKAVREIGGRSKKMGRPKGVNKTAKNKDQQSFIDATAERVIAAERAKMVDATTVALAASQHAFLQQMATFQAIGQRVLDAITSPATKAQMKLEQAEIEAQMKLEKAMERQSQQLDLDLQQVKLQIAQTVAARKEQLQLVNASNKKKKAKLEHRREESSILAASVDSGSVPSTIEHHRYASDVEDYLYE